MRSVKPLNIFHRLFSNQDSYLRQVLNQAIDAVVTIDEDNHVTYFNSAAEKLWGYQKHEVIGKNVRILVPLAIQHEHDQYVNDNRDTGIDKIVGTSRDIKVERKDGTSIWCNLSLSKVRTQSGICYTAFVKDISKQKSSAEIIDQTLEQCIDAVVTIDESNRVVFFNKAAEKLWGFHRDQVLGQNVKMLVPVNIQSSHDNYINSNRETNVDKIVGTSRDLAISTIDNRQLWVNLSLSKNPIRFKNSLYRFCQRYY